MKEQLQQTVPKMYSKELLEVLFKLPYTKRRFLEEGLHISLKTAGQYLNKLEAVGILRVKQVRIEKLYLNPEFLELLKSDAMEYDSFTVEDQIDSNE